MSTAAIRTRPAGGPWFQIADEALRPFDEYQQFRAGNLERQQYVRFVDRMRDHLVGNGLPPNDVEFAKRYPSSHDAFVALALQRLASLGILDGPARGPHPMTACYDHGSYRTYIYPEERLLLYEIARRLQPRVTIFLGSYYGYWAGAVIDAVGPDCRVVLVDPDERTQEVASRNFSRCSNVDIVVATGQRYLSEAEEKYDLIVLDAEGPRDHPDPRQRGKRIYEPLLESARPHVSTGSMLVCHNIIFHDETGSGFMQQVVDRNRDELRGFMKLVQAMMPNFTELFSTEGVGVGTAC
jgi:predicted O-methyltransferase YrrM